MLESKLYIDPVHKTLHDRQGRVLKRLHCPKRKTWHQLSGATDDQPQSRHCDSCDKAVFDTAQMTAQDVLQSITENPEVCLRLNLEQPNIQVKVFHG